MPIVTLSSEFCKNAVCTKGKTKENYYDTAITGFILEARVSGGKTYALRYKDQYGKQCQIKIGDWKSITFEKAKNAAQIIRSKVVLGQDPGTEKKIKKVVPTLADFCRDRYLPYIKGFKKSPNTDISYLRCHILPRFGKMTMDKITQQEVVEFYHGIKAKGYAMGTANQAFFLLRAIFNLGITWKIPGIEVNPALGVKVLDANNARERYLTVEETERLRQVLARSANLSLKSIVELLLLLGCRKRELLDSSWADFDLERRSWRIPMTKSGKSRHVPLSKAALEILAQLPRYEGCPYLLPNPVTRKPYASIYTGWDNARKAAGLPDVRIHDLRHSCASFMVNSGRSIYEVSQILGHSELKTTQRYAHLSQDTLLAAVDAGADAAGMSWSTQEETGK
jgi:integrase